MKRRFSPEAQAALIALLSQSEPEPSPAWAMVGKALGLVVRTSPRCGHRVTCPGAPNRMLTAWLPAARVFIEKELAKRTGATEGWKPAVGVRTHRLLRMRGE